MEVVPAETRLASMLVGYAKECFDAGIMKYEGVEQTPESYLAHLVECSISGSELPNGYLPSKTYYCVSDSEILGAIRIRFGSSDQVENAIGHIGYETRPSARGKGVATFLLSWVRSNVLETHAIVTCSTKNPASRTVIEKCGGEYLGNYTDNSLGEVRRYRLARA